MEVFGERDPGARAAVIAEIYAGDVAFADPEEVVIGHAELDRKAQDLLDKAPGLIFRSAGPAQVVQNLVLLAWELGPAGQPPVAAGKDIMIVEDGRITRLYTLLDAR
jgi:hypothetical protein